MSAKTVDGFPIVNTISFIPEVIEPPINQWSSGKIIKIEVDDGMYRPIKKVIHWKGQTDTVLDYELFVGIIQDWMKREKWTKEQALDEWFSMVNY